MVKATVECPAARLTLFRSAPESRDRVTNECRSRYRLTGPGICARFMIGTMCRGVRFRKWNGVPRRVANTRLLFWYFFPIFMRAFCCAVLCLLRALAMVLLKLIVLMLEFVFTSSIFQRSPFFHQMDLRTWTSRFSRSRSGH